MATSPSRRQLLLKRLLPIGVALALITFGLYWLAGRPKTPLGPPPLRVLSYSAFLSSWGPGPEIAKLFTETTGIPIEYHDAGDAGLLLKQMQLFPTDVVVGMDEITMQQSHGTGIWRDESSVLPIDAGPIAFVYREGEIKPPTSLDDLLDPRFKSSIALEDPRTSTPGLQLFFWILDEYGIDKGFEFLEKLKPNVHSVSPSWSMAYGLFSKKQVPLVLSYLTSPIYHWVEDKDKTYRGAVFPAGHPQQVEFAGAAANCRQCDDAALFITFLREPRIQKIIMQKNYMLPVTDHVREGTEFENLPQFNTRPWKNLDELIKRREELFERWRKLGI